MSQGPSDTNPLKRLFTFYTEGAHVVNSNVGRLQGQGVRILVPLDLRLRGPWKIVLYV